MHQTAGYIGVVSAQSPLTHQVGERGRKREWRGLHESSLASRIALRMGVGLGLV